MKKLSLKEYLKAEWECMGISRKINITAAVIFLLTVAYLYMMKVS